MTFFSTQRFSAKPFLAKRFAMRSALAAVGLLAGCAGVPAEPGENWAAHGFMAPGPVGESEIIGLYVDRGECERAARDWTERQVAGNPVFAECYPIDKT